MEVNEYQAAFLMQLGTTMFGIYLPVMVAILVARERVCQHTGAPALCRWLTRSLVTLAVFVASVFLLPCYILAEELSEAIDDDSHVVFFVLWALVADASSLLVLSVWLRWKGYSADP